MKKILTVEGMQCEHCMASVENALTALDGVISAKVDLKKKTAAVSLAGDVSDDVLVKAVTDAGFQVKDISEKKGLFNR